LLRGNPMGRRAERACLHLCTAVFSLAAAVISPSAQQLPGRDLAATKAEYKRPPPRPIENPGLVELGRMLFWDPRISASGKTACVNWLAVE
jgi:cytochrome c peroxidase